MPPTKTENIRPDVARCNVALTWSTVYLAGAVVVTGVLTVCCLIAVAADHLSLKGTRLVNALDSRLGLAHNGDFITINARVVELARKTLGVEPVARHVRWAALVASISNQGPRLELLLGNISDAVDQVCLASVNTRNCAFVCENQVMNVFTGRVPQDVRFSAGQLRSIVYRSTADAEGKNNERESENSLRSSM